MIVIDIARMSILSTRISEKHLLEMAVSPDDHTLILRNWRNIELFDLTKGVERLASIVVDPTPNDFSVGSGTRLAFATDGSVLYYLRPSNTDSDIVALSTKPLQIQMRWKVGPYANAIGVLPYRQWILVTSGLTGDEQIAAFEMKTHAVIFKSILSADSSPRRPGRDRCPSRSPAPD